MSDDAVRGPKSSMSRRVEKYIPPTSWAAGSQRYSYFNGIR